MVDFYFTHSKLQYLTWSVQKIKIVKVTTPFTVGSFINVNFTVTRGSENVIHEFTLADLPNLNPHD